MKKTINRRIRAKKVRRRKVAQLAAYSRQHTVNNCTIPSPTGKIIQKKVKWGTIEAVEGTAEWKIPERSIQKIVLRASDFPVHKPFRMSKEQYNEALIAHKIERWIRKHPRPIPPNDKEPDLFEQEFMAPWKEAYNKAIEHIREVILSKHDKLPLTGRFQKSDTEFVEEKVANIKDTEREGDKINHLDPKKSPLLKKAQKKTNQIKAKRSNLVCTNLRDRKNKKGRIILPKVA